MQNDVDFRALLRDSGMPVDKTAIRDTLQQAADEAGMITNRSRQSPFWRLVTLLVITPYLWIVDALINGVLRNLFLKTASDVFVDLYADSLDLKRKPASYTRGKIHVTKRDKNTDVTIAAGTQIQTERINGVIYTVTVDATHHIPAGRADGFVSVTATAPGTAFNLAAGYYQILPVEISGVASVRNEDDWLTTPGANEETDDELKDRCRNQFNLAGSYHTDAVYRSLIAAQAGLSIDRVFFKHDAPRGPGTANAYLLLDTGIISQPYLESVNSYITDQGHHGHGDDMRCFAMPETRHTLAVTVFVNNMENISPSDIQDLKSGVTNVVRCAFRENDNYAITRVWPYSRFSFSQLGREIHEIFPQIESLSFSLQDIRSELTIPRLSALTVEVENA
ncbi:baseplate J/gp47 family protein [Edwardsiella tarda]|uniref:baseplate J/gp47 family protein n=1 Tax=Edwardsiella tarda TaxID=636 RepID=UPI002443D9F9|nr:baseplate J/gp47 family protein [Edwardsiella tarda]WGE29412.1 baseplate J/gp47 family protein [Edwardsiella tarda]